MAGFGFIREMNDQIKQNRALLKANKKDPFQRITAKRTNDISYNDPKASEAERIRLVHATWKANAQEYLTLAMIAVIVISLTLVLVVIVLS